MIKTLTFSTLFPNPSQPRHGVFVESRLRQVIETGLVKTVVVAPVPWYPRRGPDVFGYGKFRNIPSARRDNGLDVRHPRYPVIPAFGMTVAPTLMANAVSRPIREIIESDGPFDLIDAHYFYPDGVAAAQLSRRFDIPLVITARGTDINLIPRYRLARRQILDAAQRASALISVSDSLRNRMIEIGIDGEKITTLRNGVDPELFYPSDRDDARRQLGLSGPTLLSVGHLIERKGHHLVVEALSKLPEFELIIIGAGDWEAKLRTLVNQRNLDQRVTFAGEMQQSELRRYYVACDATVLASSREGMANVMLESIACGCPVVATNVWGAPEIITERAAGVLIPERTADSIRESVNSLFADLPRRAETEAYSANLLWEPTTQGQLDIFRDIAAARRQKARSNSRYEANSF